MPPLEISVMFFNFRKLPELRGPFFKLNPMLVIVELDDVDLGHFSRASGETQQFVMSSVAWMELLLCLLDVSSVSQVLASAIRSYHF